MLRKYISSLLFLSGLLLCNFYAIAQSPDFNAKIAQSLQDYVEAENVSQVMVAVSLPKQNTMVFTNSQANLKKNHFPVASLSKTFTAALILKLSQQGKLNLNDTLGGYFPEYAKWGHVTITMLLNQTSGLPDYINTPNFFTDMAKHPEHLYTSQELLTLAYKMPIVFLPGQKWNYSNTNYLLLGLIAEKVSQKTLPTLFNEELFIPHKLSNTIYSSGYYPQSVQNHMMNGYFAAYPSTPTNMTWGQAAAGIVSTPDDLITWIKAIYIGKQTGFRQAIKNNRIDLNTGKMNNDINTPSYGMGVFTINTPYGLLWYTPGMASGYRNILAYFPCEGVFIVASINNGHTSMAISAKLLTLIMQNLLSNKTYQGQIIVYQKTTELPEYCKMQKPASISLPIF